MTTAQERGFSKVKEVVAAWNNVRQLLRSGEQGALVPVVIPKDKRGFRWLFWFALAFYILAMALYFVFTGRIGFFVLTAGAGVFFMVLGAFTWWRSAIVEIEQGTNGVYSRYGKIEGVLEPGRNYLWWPWEKVEFIVDTATEIPYTAPVLSSPTQENVPLKSIEFFLKFRIIDPIKFVQSKA